MKAVNQWQAVTIPSNYDDWSWFNLNLVVTSIIQGTPQMVHPNTWIWGRHALVSDLGLIEFSLGYRVLLWSNPSMSSLRMEVDEPLVPVACSLRALSLLWVCRYIRTFLMCSLCAFSSCCRSGCKEALRILLVNYWVHLSTLYISPWFNHKILNNICSLYIFNIYILYYKFIYIYISAKSDHWDTFIL